MHKIIFHSICLAGIFIFVMSFLGCCGACKDKPCIMYTYAAILAIIIVAEISAGISCYVLKGSIKEVVEDNMEEGMDDYKVEGHEDMTGTWDRMQEDRQTQILQDAETFLARMEGGEAV